MKLLSIKKKKHKSSNDLQRHSVKSLLKANLDLSLGNNSRFHTFQFLLYLLAE